MSEIRIPAAALEAGARAAHDQWRHECADEACEPVENWREWDELDEWEQDSFRAQARAAFLSMIEAWPGMAAYSAGTNGPYPYIILPLTEKTDA